MNRKCFFKNKKYILFSGLILIIFLYFFNQQKYRISLISYDSDINIDNIAYIVKLRMSLSKIESKYPGFLPPVCTCGEQHTFGDSESEEDFNNLTKLTAGKLLWYLTLKTTPYYDYCNDEPGSPLKERFFRTLPEAGTYSAAGGGDFLEVNKNGFVIVVVCGFKHEIYRLKDEFKDLPVSSLKQEHFQYLRSIPTDKNGNTRINLPFGTYLTRFNSKSYNIISIFPE